MNKPVLTTSLHLCTHTFEVFIFVPPPSFGYPLGRARQAGRVATEEGGHRPYTYRWCRRVSVRQPPPPPPPPPLAVTGRVPSSCMETGLDRLRRFPPDFPVAKKNAAPVEIDTLNYRKLLGDVLVALCKNNSSRQVTKL